MQSTARTTRKPTAQSRRSRLPTASSRRANPATSMRLVSMDPAPGVNGIRDGSQDATVSQQFIKMSKMMIDDIHAKETGQAKNIPGIVWPLKVINADNINSDDVKQYGIWADDVK